MPYCLESKDLPDGADINNVRIPSDIALRSSPASDLRFGIEVLEGRALYLDEKASGDELYRPLGAPGMTEMPVRLIPYFAWNNRGPTAMSVWLPLDVR